MPANYGPTDSIIEGQRGRSRKLMAQSLIKTPGVGDGFQQQADPHVAIASHELYRQGLQAYLGKDQAGAMAHWKKALQLNPADQESRQGLARLAQAGQIAEPPNAESGASYREGLAQYLTGNEMGAAQGWQKAYAADPRNLSAKRGLQRILMQMMQGQR